MRFSLIDQVLEQQPQRLVAVKAVTTAEEYLGDHFPGFAVLPGVMMLETLVQAARLMVKDQTDAWPLVLESVRNIRYGNMVRPGQLLKVNVDLKSREGDRFDLVGVGEVEDQVAVKGRFTLAPMPEG